MKPLGLCLVLCRHSPLSGSASICAHSFIRNWHWLPFLNQWKGENNCRKYFMINLHERMVPDPVGIQPSNSWSPVGRASDWAIEAGTSKFQTKQHVQTLHIYPKHWDASLITTQPSARRCEHCCVLHYCSRTDTIKQKSVIFVHFSIFTLNVGAP